MFHIGEDYCIADGFNLLERRNLRLYGILGGVKPCWAPICAKFGSLDVRKASLVREKWQVGYF